mmetsp:Transcript_18813/g.40984  ORF Transcript_18813/g.40984 Transcript_18813/m.40984 type:complete len:282 (+) Transcript_18813:131-976(+)
MSKGGEMELLSLKPSPYSRRVVWALKLLGLDYQSSQYSPIAGEPALRWRLGRWNPWTPASVPVAFIQNENGAETVLENGVDIVEWANERAAASTTTSNQVSLVPAAPALRSQVLEYCGLADDFQNFDRSMFFKVMADDAPTALRVAVGDEPPDMALRAIGAIVGCFMRTKYRATLHATSSEIQEKAKRVEDELRDKQKCQQQQGSSALVYLVGEDLTMADLFLSIAIVNNRSKPLSEHQQTLDNVVALQQGFSFEKDYPVLYKWAVDISEKHSVDASLFED